MLKSKDIKYLRTSQGKAATVGMWVIAVGIPVILFAGIFNMRLAYKAKAQYDLPFVIPDKSALYMKEKYLGAHLYAQGRFLSGLMQLLVGGIVIPMQVYMAWTFRHRNKRILKFIEEHGPTDIQ